MQATVNRKSKDRAKQSPRTTRQPDASKPAAKPAPQVGNMVIDRRWIEETAQVAPKVIGYITSVGGKTLGYTDLDGEPQAVEIEDAIVVPQAADVDDALVAPQRSPGRRFVGGVGIQDTHIEIPEGNAAHFAEALAATLRAERLINALPTCPRFDDYRKLRLKVDDAANLLYRDMAEFYGIFLEEEAKGERWVPMIPGKQVGHEIAASIAAQPGMACHFMFEGDGPHFGTIVEVGRHGAFVQMDQDDESHEVRYEKDDVLPVLWEKLSLIPAQQLNATDE